MIELIRNYLPYLFVLYFVIKGVKSPIYLMGIPFLMFMSQSIFFEDVKLFKMPGSLQYALMFIWLAALWIVSFFIPKENDEETVHNKRLNVLDYIIFALIIISFAGLTYAFLKYTYKNDLIKEFVQLISLFLAYLIIRKWSIQNSPEILIKFLYSIVVINSIASLFYILHQGLHFGIYEAVEFSTEIFDGAEITRSFWFMPQFLPFSVAFLLVFKDRGNFLAYLLLAINLLAIFISYTRSSVVNAIIISLLYLVLKGIKSGRMGMVLRNIFLYGIVGIISLFILAQIFPANTKYFERRFTELSETSATSGPNNMQYRFIMAGIIISNIDADKKIFGMGPVTESQIPMVKAMRQTTADMVWTGVIYRWGYVGLILFVMLYLFGLFKGYFYYMNSDSELADLALLFLLFIFSQLIESFFSWTFLSGHGLATGLWYFAMLSAVLGFTKSTKPSAEEISYESE